MRETVEGCLKLVNTIQIIGEVRHPVANGE